MAEYIDAKALYEKLYDADAITIRGCEIFRGFPAADVAEVRRGEWIGIQYDGYADGEPVYDEYECSVCGAEYSITHSFCPNCGAKMKG